MYHTKHAKIVKLACSELFDLPPWALKNNSEQLFLRKLFSTINCLKDRLD